MALTYAKPTHVHRIGDHMEVVTDVAFDSSYPTGGLALDAKKLGLRLGRIYAVRPGLVSTGGTASPVKTVVYDHINNKLVLLPTAGTEATNASSQATVSVRLLVLGK